MKKENSFLSFIEDLKSEINNIQSQNLRIRATNI